MSKISPIKKRILAYLEYRGMSEYEFYKDSDMSRRTLKQQTGISEDNLAKFLAYDKETNPGQRVSLDWLLRGEGTMMEAHSPEHEILALEPGPEYGGDTKEQTAEAILKHLTNLAEAYSNKLRDIAKSVKKMGE